MDKPEDVALIKEEIHDELKNEISNMSGQVSLLLMWFVARRVMGYWDEGWDNRGTWCVWTGECINSFQFFYI